jgi:hypothetical protein
MEVAILNRLELEIEIVLHFVLLSFSYYSW